MLLITAADGHLLPESKISRMYWSFISEEGGIAVRYDNKEVCVNFEKVSDISCNHSRNKTKCYKWNADSEEDDSINPIDVGMDDSINNLDYCTNKSVNFNNDGSDFSERKINNKEFMDDSTDKSKVTRIKIEKSEISMNKENVLKKFKCDQHGCPKSYSTRQSLKYHILTHSGPLPYACDECSKSFTQNSNLQIHRRIHSGEKPYKCDECDQKFVQHSQLQQHKRKHSGIKPYSCDLCEDSFVANAQLNSHKESHFRDAKYKCGNCTASFIQKKYLGEHTKVHNRCVICLQSFLTKQDLENHQIDDHPLFNCDQCDNSFDSVFSLKEHQMKDHLVKDSLFIPELK